MSINSTLKMLASLKGQQKAQCLEDAVADERATISAPPQLTPKKNPDRDMKKALEYILGPNASKENTPMD